MLPSDLFTQIFEVESLSRDADILEILLVVGQNDFLISIFVGEFLLKNRDFSLFFQLFFDPAHCVLCAGFYSDIAILILDVESCHI